MKTSKKLADEFFYSIDNIKAFDIFGVNIVKLCLTHYVFSQLNSNKNIVKAQNRKTTGNQYIRLLKQALTIIKWRFTKEIVFLGVGGRTVKINNLDYDIYNFNLINLLKKRAVLYIETPFQNTKKTYSPQYYKTELTILAKFSKREFSKNNAKYKKQIECFIILLNKTNPRFVLNNEKIKSVIINFLKEYLFYNLLFKVIKPKKIFLIGHYGREAQIFAGKKNNVEVIEFQHGLILSTHPFYNLPNISYSKYLFKSAAFPDKICVYGQNWKNILIDGKLYPEESIVISGYYQKGFEPNYKLRNNLKKTILITSQYTVQKEIINYIKFLKEKLNSSKWKIIVKPHPAEDRKEFKKVIDNKLVFLSFDNVYELLNNSDIHITVYSSLVFEAIRYKVANYSLYVERYKNECNEITNLKVAKRLNNNELPEIYTPSINQTIFYENFPTKEFENEFKK